MARAVDGLPDVRDDPASPAAQLVAEDLQTAEPGTADRPLRDDAAVWTVALADRRRLDGVAQLRGVEYAELEASVERNAARVFGW